MYFDFIFCTKKEIDNSYAESTAVFLFVQLILCQAHTILLYLFNS